MDDSNSGSGCRRGQNRTATTFHTRHERYTTRTNPVASTSPIRFHFIYEISHDGLCILHWEYDRLISSQPKFIRARRRAPSVRILGLEFISRARYIPPGKCVVYPTYWRPKEQHVCKHQSLLSNTQRVDANCCLEVTNFLLGAIP